MPPVIVPVPPPPDTPELAAMRAAHAKLGARIVCSLNGPASRKYIELILFQDWVAAATLVPEVIAEIDALPKLAPAKSFTGHEYLAPVVQPGAAKPGESADLKGRSWGADSGVPK